MRGFCAVWKYPVPEPETEAWIDMPKGARFLSLQVQKKTAQMWFLVDPIQNNESRKFAVVGTGSMSVAVDRCDFLGTYQELGGDFVWHVFEKRSQ